MHKRLGAVVKKLWAFISTPQNLAVLAALGAGLGFLWKEVIPHKEPAKIEAPAPAQTATTNNGNAVNASGSSQAHIGPTSATAPAPSLEPQATKQENVSGQAAQAGPGGVAVNASGSARVSVTGGSGVGQ